MVNWANDSIFNHFYPKVQDVYKQIMESTNTLDVYYHDDDSEEDYSDQDFFFFSVKELDESANEMAQWQYLLISGHVNYYGIY